MVFSSLSFLFAFLPLCFLIYFIVPQKFRNIRNTVLLIFSLFFYFAGEPKYLVIMILSIIANYLLALGIGAVKKNSGRIFFLILSLSSNLGLLVYFKYTDFFISNINSVLGANIPLQNIIMPIGISFFTFQGLSYVLDVYMGKVKVQKNLLYVATYVALFPQLVAGPIVRYETVETELGKRKENLTDITWGLRRFIYGLAKKMLLANTLGQVATEIFALDPSARTCALAWVGAVAYSFQIFFDFSGYSDMAIGLGKVFGFNFLENFNYPYISRSITEFWRRWHISLGSWFRDYLYIPLGGNRRGAVRQILNIFTVWALTGLWHGASWNFVLWGVYFAVLLITEKLFLKKILDKIPHVFSHIYALFFIIIGWIIFNSPDMPSALTYTKQLFGAGTAQGLSGNRALYYLWQYKAEFICAVIFSLPLAKALSKKMKNGATAELLRNTGALILLILSVLSVVNTSFNPFIYFRF
ncbi:MAG: MBOAT family protein [Clostridia bacterium]|nr:MBOAT family protein [Clostridia bacterium]